MLPRVHVSLQLILFRKFYSVILFHITIINRDYTESKQQTYINEILG